MACRAAAQPLQGCSIATSGKFTGTTQGDVAQRVTSLGATVATKVSADTAFLIATAKDFDGNSTKVKAAASHKVPVVTLDWLQACESTNAKADETQYLLSSAPPPAPAPAPPPPKKRAAASSGSPAASQDPSQAKKPKIAHGQNAKSKQATIPTDEYCPLSGYAVHVDDDGTIWDASLNQTNAAANNNKFYKIQLLRDAAESDFKTFCRWGRVGEPGAKSVLGSGSLSDALKNFEKKFRDKSGLKWADRALDPIAGKYAYVERSYNPDSDDEDDGPRGTQDEDQGSKKPLAESKLEPPVQRLMELIFNQSYFDAAMSALNYDATKLPLGKLSKATIARGFQALKDLSVLLDKTDGTSRDQVEHLSNLYFSVIPHAFGRNRPPIIRDSGHLKREIELLESLSDMKEAAAILKSTLKDDADVAKLDRQFAGLNMNEMTALDHNSPEFTELSRYLNNSKGATHSVTYQVDEIFRIERQGELERFEQSEFSKIASNRRLLWHGSRVTNFGGILGQGLRIAPPEAPVSGYMFGKGIYLADMSSKSASYCRACDSGNTALLLLCDAELGDPMYELTESSYHAGEEARSKGMYSTWGQGTTGPSKWKDAKCVHASLAGCMMPDVSVEPSRARFVKGPLQYHEYIAYDVAQVRLRYLLRVRVK